jgi:hypothetical protein
MKESTCFNCGVKFESDDYHPFCRTCLIDYPELNREVDG